MFLIDTNVISEARKGQRADGGVQAFWAEAARNDTSLYLAATTTAEFRLLGPASAVDTQATGSAAVVARGGGRPVTWFESYGAASR